LPAGHPVDGEPIRYGRIYLAPPDLHMLPGRGQVRRSRGPRENGHRPAVDPLFRSAARLYGRRVEGVVLSGSLDDSSAGLADIQRQGGVAIVQDPQEALYAGMPRSAIVNVPVDHVLRLAALGATLERLAREPLPEGGVDPMPDETDLETAYAAFEHETIQSDQHPGVPSGFGCPDCGGVLWELRERELVRFRCRVGHAWTANGPVAEQNDAMERALWVALRALEERASLSARIAARFHERGHSLSAERFEQQVQQSKNHAVWIRQILASDRNQILEPAAGEDRTDPVPPATAARVAAMR
jgi:two-component system chemotaxis response regulator CheB